MLLWHFYVAGKDRTFPSYNEHDATLRQKNGNNR